MKYVSKPVLSPFRLVALSVACSWVTVNMALGEPGFDVQVVNTTANNPSNLPDWESLWNTIDTLPSGSTGTIDGREVQYNSADREVDFNYRTSGCVGNDRAINTINGDGPGGGGGPFNGGNNYSIRGETLLHFTVGGTYTIAVGSDDGRRIELTEAVAGSAPGYTGFTSVFGQYNYPGGFTSGDTVIGYSAGTGHQETYGVFTVAAGDVLRLEFFYYQGGGGHSGELLIYQGDPGSDTCTDSELLTDGVFGIEVDTTLDADGDGVFDFEDNCPTIPNPDQDPDACDCAPDAFAPIILFPNPLVLDCNDPTTPGLTPALTVTSGLELWFDGSDIDGGNDGSVGDPAIGGTVASWVDKSGNGYLADDVLGDPTVEAGPNGTTVLAFDGNDALRTANASNPRTILAGQDAYTLITVARYAGSDRERVIAAKSNHNWLFGFHQNTVNRWHYNGWLSLDVGGRVQNDNTWQLHMGEVHDLNSGNPLGSTWRNGEVLTVNGNGSRNSFNDNVPDGLSFGAWDGVRESSQSEVAEVLMFNRVLTPAELEDIGSYLEGKYGLDTTYAGIPDLTATVLDFCDPDATAVFAGDTVPVGNSCSSMFIRTWTSTDASGNMATSNQTIVVLDTTPPAFDNAPTNEMVILDASCMGVPPAAPVVTATDDCQPPASVTVVGPMETDTGTGCERVITRVWTAEDVCGNTNYHTQTIIFVDTMTPTFTFVPADVTLECGSDTSPSGGGGGSATGTDECSASITDAALARGLTVNTYYGNIPRQNFIRTQPSILPSIAENIGCSTLSEPLDFSGDGTFRSKFDPNLPADDYIVTFDGFLVVGPGQGGNWEFRLGNTDDRSAIYIDLDGDGDFDDGTSLDTSAGNERVRDETGSATVSLTAGTTYRFMVLHHEHGGGSSVQAYFTPPGGVESLIDPSMTDQPFFASAVTYCDTPVSTGTSCIDYDTIQRVWTINDGCGNTATATQIISLVDTTDPVFDAGSFPGDTSIDCAAGATANPSIFSGLTLWLDASDPGTLAQDSDGTTASGNGDPVGRWIDKSGNGYDVQVHSVAGSDDNRRPIYNATAFNGMPTVQFDGTDDILKNLIGNESAFDFTANDEMTVFAVAEVKSGNTGNWEPWVAKRGESGQGWQLRRHGNHDHFVFTIRGHGNDDNHNGGPAQNDPIFGIEQIYAARYQSAGLQGRQTWLNGRLSTDITETGDIAGGDSSFTLGGRDNDNQDDDDGYNAYAEVDISEVVIFDRALSDEEANALGDYLADKWGLTTSYTPLNLSYADPFFTGSPTGSDTCDPDPEITYFDIANPAPGGGTVLTRTFTITDSCGHSVTHPESQSITLTGGNAPVITQSAPYEDYGCQGDQRTYGPGDPGLAVTAYYDGSIDRDNDELNLPSLLDGYTPDFTGGLLAEAFDYDNDGDFRDEYDPNLPNDDYLHAFNGVIYLQPGEGGPYRFKFDRIDNRAALFIDLNGNGVFDDGATLEAGERILFNSTLQSPTITLEEEVEYRFLVIHKEDGGGSQLEVRYQRPGGAFTLIDPRVEGQPFYLDADPPEPTYQGTQPFAVTDADGDDTIVRTQLVWSTHSTVDCHVAVTRLWRVTDECGLFADFLESYEYDMIPQEIADARLRDLDLGCINTLDQIPPPDFMESGTMTECGALTIKLATQAPPGSAWTTTTNALRHFGYHANTESLLNFHDGGGLFQSGCLDSNASFNAKAYLTDGPGGRGLDYNGDGDFVDVVSQGDNYESVWIGTLTVSEDTTAKNAAGTWTFDMGNSDDRGGLWIDLNQDGVFTSDDGTLSDVAGLNGELINWENGDVKSVNLAPGNYMIAFVHLEYGGGSSFDYTVGTPNLYPEIVNPSDPDQEGFWSVSEDNTPGMEGCIRVLPYVPECREAIERIYTVGTRCSTVRVSQIITYILDTAPPIITNLAPYVDYGCNGDMRELNPFLPGLAVRAFYGRPQNNDEINLPSLVDVTPSYSGGFLSEAFNYNGDADFRDEYDPNQPDNNYIYVFEGIIRLGPGEGGNYHFQFAGTDDRSALFIDLNGNGVFDDGTTLDAGERIINDSTDASSPVPLAEGIDYRFMVVHKEFGGGSTITVSYQPPGGSFREIDPTVPGQPFYAQVTTEPTYGGMYSFGVDDPDGADTVISTTVVQNVYVTNDCQVTVYRTWRVEDCCGRYDEAQEIYAFNLLPKMIASVFPGDVDLGCIASTNMIPPPEFILPVTCGTVNVTLSNETPLGVGYVTTVNALRHYGYDENNDALLNFHNGGGLFNGACFDQHGTFNSSVLFTDGPDGNGLDYGNGEFSPPTGRDNDFMGVWAGTLIVSSDPTANNAAGMWTFDLGNSDDIGGLWIDLDRDGVFESDDGTVANVAGLKGELINWDNGGAKSVNLAAGEYLVAFVHREGGGSENFSYSVGTPNLAVELVNPSDPDQNGMWAVSENTAPGMVGCLRALPVQEDACESILERTYTIATGCETATVRQLVRYTINSAAPVIANVAPYVDYGCLGDLRALPPSPGLQAFDSNPAIDNGDTLGDWTDVLGTSYMAEDVWDGNAGNYGGRGTGGNTTGGNQDAAHPSLIMRSPVFRLDSSSVITFWLTGGDGSATSAPANESMVPANSTSGGFQGIALRREATGDYVLSERRMGNDNSYQRRDFTAAELAPIIAAYPGELFTLDFVDYYGHGSDWGFAMVDDVNIQAAGMNPNYGPPGTFIAEDDDTNIVSTTLVQNVYVTNDCQVTVYRTWRVEDCCGGYDEAQEIYSFDLLPQVVMGTTLRDLNLGCISSTNQIPPPDFIEAGTMATCGDYKVTFLHNTQSVPYASVVMTDGPVVYYPFDDAAGTASVANEGSSGSGYDTQAQSSPTFGVPSFSTSMGTAVDLGTAGYFDMTPPASGNSASTDPHYTTWLNSDNSTLEFWINTTQDGSGLQAWQYPTLMGDDNLGCCGNTWNVDSWWGVIDADGNIGVNSVGGSVGGDGPPLDSASGAPINDGAWHHIVLVRGIGGAITVYVDGAVSGAGGNMNSNADNLWDHIGLNPDAGTHLDAMIDEVAIYDYMLPPERIAAHYDAVSGSTDGSGCDSCLMRVYEVSTPCFTQEVAQTVCYTLNTAPPVITNVAPYVDFGCDGDLRALPPSPGPQTFDSNPAIDNGDTLGDWTDVLGTSYMAEDVWDGNSGNYGGRGTGGNTTGGNQDAAHPSLIMRSPVFRLDSSSVITFWLTGGDGSATSAPANESMVPANSTSGGFQGIALRREATGDYVLSERRMGNDNSYQRRDFTAAELAPIIAAYPGELFTLDFVDYYGHGSDWGFAMVDDVNIQAAGMDPNYGTPGTFIAEDNDTNIVSTTLVQNVYVTNGCQVTVFRTWRVEDCCGQFDEAQEIYSYDLLVDDIHVTLPEVNAGCVGSVDELPLAGVGDIQVVNLGAMGDNPLRYQLPVTAGLAMWLDAEDPAGDGSYLTDGPLTTWVDKSPENNDLNAIANRHPDLVRMAINDRPVVRFDVNDFLLRAADVNGWNPDDVSIFFVTRTAVINQNYFFQYNGPPNQRHSMHHPWDDNNVYWDWGNISQSGGRLNVNQAGNVPVYGVWNVYNTVDDGKGIVFNGTVQTTGPGRSSPIDNVSGFALGANEGGGQGWGGDVAEFIVYNRRLTPDETQDVGAYLAAKYDLPTAYASANPLQSGLVATPCSIDSVTLVGTVPVAAGDADPVLLPPPVAAETDPAAFNSNYLVGNLFDGEPAFGSTANLGRDYATSQMDTPSVLYFDFGTTITATHIGYAQRAGSLANDKVAQMEFWFSDIDPGGATIPAGPPDAVVHPTELSKIFTAYSLGGTHQGRYVVARFTGNDFYPGGFEFRFANACGTAVDRLYQVEMGCNSLQVAQRVHYVERGPVPRITEVAPFVHFGCDTEGRSLEASLERVRFNDPSGAPVRDQFYPIASVSSSTGANDFYPVGNLIQGAGVGFSDAPPYNKLLSGATGNWVTDAPGGFPSDYIAVAGMPVLVLDLGADVSLSEISVWGYDQSNGNGVREFSLRFATAGDGSAGFGTSVTYNPTFLPLNQTTPRQSFAFDQAVTARYVEFTCVDNDFGNVVGGDRVGLGEIAFQMPGAGTPQFVRGPFLVRETKEQIGCDVIVRRTWRVENCCGDWHEMDESFAYTAPPAEPSLSTLDAFAPGVYDIDLPGGGVLPLRVSSDGERNWLLVGRGREGWDFDADGPGNESAVPWNLGTPAAFAPAALTDSTINGILAQAGLNLTQVEIRLRRALTPDGSAYQDVIWRSNGQSAWTWDFDDAAYSIQHYIAAGQSGGPWFEANEDTRDTVDNNTDNNERRVFTWPWGGHNDQRGFAYGGVDSLGTGLPTSGADTADTFLWDHPNNGFNHPIPYTEVYIRSLEPQAEPVGLVVAPPAPLHLGCIASTDQIPPLDLTMLGVTSDCPYQVWKVRETDPVLTADGCTYSNERAFVVGTDCHTVMVWQAVTWIPDEGQAEVVDAAIGSNWGCRATDWLPPTNYDAIAVDNVATETVACTVVPLVSQDTVGFVQGALQLDFAVQASSTTITGGDAADWDLSGNVVHAVDFQNNGYDRVIQGIPFEWYPENPQVDITSFSPASCLGSIGDFGNSLDDEELRFLAGNLYYGSGMNISYRVPTGRMYQVELVTYSGSCGGRWEDVMLDGEEVFDNAFAPANPNGATVLRMQHCAFTPNHTIFMGSAGTFGAGNPGTDPNAVIGGMIVRDIGPCVFDTTGSFTANVSKNSLDLWRELALSESIPDGASIVYTVSDPGGAVYVNAQPSQNGVLDLSAVPATADDLVIRVDFSTTDPSVSPTLSRMVAKSGRLIPNIDNPFISVSDVSTTNDCEVTVFRTIRADGCCGDFHERLEIHTFAVSSAVPPVIIGPESVYVGCIDSFENLNFLNLAEQFQVDFPCPVTITNLTNLPVVDVDTCLAGFTSIYQAVGQCGESSTFTQWVTYAQGVQPEISSTASNHVGGIPPPIDLGCHDPGVVPAGTAADWSAWQVAARDLPTLNDSYPPDQLPPGADLFTNTYLIVTTNGCFGSARRIYEVSDCCGHHASAEQQYTWRIRGEAFLGAVPDYNVGCVTSSDEIPPAVFTMTSFTSTCGIVAAEVLGETNRTQDVCAGSVDRIYRITDHCGVTATTTQHVTWVIGGEPEIPWVEIGVDWGCRAPGWIPPTNETAMTVYSNDYRIAVSNKLFETGCTAYVQRTFRVENCCGEVDTRVVTHSYTMRPSVPTVQALQPLDVGCVDSIGLLPQPNITLVAASSHCAIAAIRWLPDADVMHSRTNCTWAMDRSYEVEDLCGQTTTLVHRLTWTLDRNPPEITAHPEDRYFGCTNSIDDAIAAATAGDNNAPGMLALVETTDDSLVVAETVTVTRATNECLVTVTLSWRVEDCCGGIDEEETVYTYTERPDLPAISALQDLFVGCLAHTNQVPQPNLTLVEATSECTIAYLDFLRHENPRTSGCTSSIDRVYEATDLCGQTAVVTQTLSWVLNDTFPEILRHELGQDWGCRPADWTPFTNMIFAFEATNHTGGVRIWEDRHTNDCTVLVVRNFRVEDCCGNFDHAQVRHTFSIEPDLPTIVPLAHLDAGCVTALGQLPQPSTALLDASSECSIVSIDFVSESVHTTNGCGATFERVYSATDLCGRTVETTQRISYTLVPGLPEITAVEPGGDIGCRPAGYVPPINTGPFRAVNHLTNSLTVTDVVDADLDGCRVYVHRTYRVENCCGDADRETVTYRYSVLQDAPTLDGDLELDLGCIVDKGQVPEPSASQFHLHADCGGTVWFVTQTVVAASACSNEIARVYTAVDDCDQSVTVTQTIRWTVDAIDPKFTHLPGGDLGCVSDEAAEVPSVDDDLAAITVTENCEVVVMPMGERRTETTCGVTLVRTYQAMDACGHSVVDSVVYTWTPTPDAPTLSGPTQVTAWCLGDASQIPEANPSLIEVTASCGHGAVQHTGDGPHQTGPAGDCRVWFLRTYEVTDGCGQSAAFTQRVDYSVQGSAELVLDGEGEDFGCVTATPSLPRVIVTVDGQAPAGLAVADTTTTNGCQVTLVRTWTLEHCCDESESLTWTWTLDAEPPTITPEPGFVQDPPIRCNPRAFDIPLVNLAQFEVTDNCGTDFAWIGDVYSESGCTGMVTRTYTATDCAGNASSIVQRFTFLVDDVAPSFAIEPAHIDLGCNPDDIPDTIISEVVNNCAGEAIQTNALPEVVEVDGCRTWITRRYEIEDSCGNRGMAEQTLTYTTDTEPPTISCPPGGDLGCDPGALPSPAVETLTVDDNCGVAEVRFVGDTVTDAGNTRTVVRVYEVEDLCGLTDRCSQVWTATLDTEIPTVTDGPVGGDLGCNPDDIPVADAALVTATDNIGQPTVTVVGDLTNRDGCVVNVTHIYAATDGCGNDTEWSVHWRWTEDTTAPTIDCPADMNIERDDNCGADTPDFTGASAGDNCGVNRVWQVPAAGTRLGLGANTVTVWVEDNCGTRNSCTVGVNVTGTCEPDVPDIELVKTVYAGQNGDAGCAAATESVAGINGAPVTYCFRVTNTGEVELRNVQLADNLIGFNRVLGDLEVGGSVLVSIPSSILGDLLNTAGVTGTPATGGPVVTDTDTASVTEINPSLGIGKSVSLDGNCPGAAQVDATNGQAVTWCIAVTNTGDVALDNIRVNDPLMGPATIPVDPSSLQPGEVGTLALPWTFTGDAVTNVASAEGTVAGGGGGPVRIDSASAAAAVVPPSAKIAGVVFYDVSNDGSADDERLDSPEIAVPGVRVVLYNESGLALREDTTGADGAYSFTGLMAGRYAVAYDATTLTDPDDAVALTLSYNLGSAQCVEDAHLPVSVIATAVDLESFTATPTAGGIRFNWAAAQEGGTLGYNVLDEAGNPLNKRLVLAGEDTYELEVAGVLTGEFTLEEITDDLENAGVATSAVADAAPLGIPTSDRMVGVDPLNWTAAAGTRSYLVRDFASVPRVTGDGVALRVAVLEVDGRVAVYFSVAPGTQVVIEP